MSTPHRVCCTLKHMRVIIDAVPLLIRSAGVKNYLYHWITHLRREAGAGTIRTFPALPALGALTHEGSVAGRARTVFGLGAFAAANHTPLPVLDWLAARADVFHASNLLRHPPRRPRLTTTVYDMTCRLLPELHSAANLRADESFAELLRRADGLIAISESTRDDTVRMMRVPAEKIAVVYPGIAEEFFSVAPAAIESVRRRYALSKPFVLSVGTVEPRKNLDTLLDAFAALPGALRDAFDLVHAGPLGWSSEKTAARLGAIRYLGYVPEPDIAPLTAAAAVFAYPSLYEGFGFPVAQAMAAGVPVITSNVSSLPEIAGDSALLIDPRSLNDLRGALTRLLESPALRTELAARGRARARRFTWQACAAQSLRFFTTLSG